MRTTRPMIAIVAAAAAAITLAGCGDDTDTPPETTATSSGQNNPADAEAEAVDASEKTIREGMEISVLAPAPSTLFTQSLRDETDAAIKTAKAEGQKASGKHDEVLWVKKSSVALPRQVAMKVCVQRNERWLNKDGKDMRGNQDGEPIKVGSKAEFLIRTVPGETEGAWLIDSISEKGTCK